MGHADGGTTLLYYAAWVREADQRACRVLMRRLPMPQPPAVTTNGVAVVPGLSRSPSPYQLIAAELRTEILAGSLPPGTVLPTVKQLAARHRVAPSTALRAITNQTAA